MTRRALIFEEPELEFRHKQRIKDPHDGLALFGPCDRDSPSHPSSLTYALIGPEDGMKSFQAWSQAMNRPATYAPGNNHRLWPPFPGFEVALCAEWSREPVWSYTIDHDELNAASRHSDPYQRAFGVVDRYLEGLRITAKRDESIDVAICVVPHEVWLNCRPESRVSDPVGRRVSKKTIRSRKAGQSELFDEIDPRKYQLSTDFRRQLKARSMQYGIPTQIIRESTLRLSNGNPFGERALTPISDRMWNISTALYYKGGGKPWRLVTARDGVCYIGISFKRVSPSKRTETACCAAQMFLSSGDGIVFLGQYGPWYSSHNHQFHLSKSAAYNLLQGVLQTYEELEGKPLTEVFLHSRSTINNDEFAGYKEACPRNIDLVAVRVRQVRSRGPRLYRNGDMPVLRGTFWRLNDRSGLLWGSGFAPRLATYRGWEVPLPLRLDIQHGDAPIERVAHDILGLTKLNYNACHLGDAEPVTIRFSDAVGEILISNPKVSDRKPNFKYYI